MPSAPAGSDRFARSGVPGDAQIESLRLPPHSVEAEQAVLGGLLLSNSAWDRIGDVVSESDFYRADHRVLWRDRKSTRLNSSHLRLSRMPSSA